MRKFLPIRLSSLLLWLGLAFVFQACSPGKKLAQDPRKVEDKLKKAYVQWEGTPYQFGGQSAKGIDCSAFLQSVYRDYFNVKLPRTTDQQMNVGKPVKKMKQLLPGDLLFFKTGNKQYHAGIYLRGNKFMHASTSKGVIIAEFDSNYWKKVFLRARRVLY